MNPAPLYSSVCAGSPFPIDETENFDLANHLIQHPFDTFFVRVAGDSMIESGIFDGDLLIVDKSAIPAPFDVVVAETDSGLTVKQFRQENGYLRLVPCNPNNTPIEVTKSTRICGVARFAIHKL